MKKSSIHPAVREYFSELGRKGGKSTSEAKLRACIENGKRGGRPKKTIDPKTTSV
jgi:general stress protein YciG